MAPESRDEVRQRIDSLYDQAENATGNFNATRAMALRARSRGVPLAKRPSRRPDPALDEITRQWFDSVRGRVGPTVPAVLPAGRLPGPVPGMPDTSVAALDRSGGGALVGGERAALGPGPAAPAPQALERGAGGAMAGLPTGGALAELPAGDAMAALPAGGAPAELPTGGVKSALPTGGGMTELPTGDAMTPLPAGGAMTALPIGNAVAGPPAARPVDPLSAVTPGGGWVAPPGTEPAQLAGTATHSVGGLPAWAPLSTPEPTVPVGTADLPGLWEQGTVSGTPATSAPVGMTDLPGLWEQGTVGGTPATSALLAAPDPALRAPGDRVQAPRPLPGAAGAGRLSPVVAKAAVRHKLAGAADLLTRHTARLARPAQAVGVTPAPVAGLPAAVKAATGAGAFTYPAPAAPVTDTGLIPYSAIPEAIPYSAIPEAIPYPAVPEATPTAPVPTFLTGGPAPLSPRASRAGKAVAFARAQIGKPCVWGATGPDSYDCSSLTQAAWRAAGVMLPRAAHEQALAGTPVTAAGIEPGDLVLFFDDDRHVGLHVGDGMMVHAPGPGSIIREESIYGAGETAIRRIVRPA
ncbi:NlpC/P60 family protein [Streptomyces sp. NPDC014636]|uniref:NlpC/P60 family protein n=1 Tax=Streptomyces sp. NPDC014636 TaxID=3364876 RepID=UPI0036F7437E